MVQRAFVGRLSLLGLLLVPLLGYAMDLQQAYEAALANDARVRASRSQAEATRENLPQAQAQRLPNVGFNASRMRNDLISKTSDFLGRPVTLGNNYYSSSQTLSVSQPLYRPAVMAAVRQARAQVDDANATLEGDEQALVQRVGAAYFEALLARDQLELVQAQKDSYTAQLDAARKNFVAGGGTRTDIDDAQARLDMTLAQELEVRQNVEFTRRQLEVMTGGAVGELAALNLQRFSPAAPQPASLQAWIEEAEAYSPQIRALRAQMEAAQQGVDKAQAGHKPTLDLVAQWSRTNSDSVTSINSRYDQKAVGLQLSVPLYSGGYVSSTVRQAVASQERARELLDAARQELGVQVHKEFRGMTEGRARIAALEQAVRSADQAVISGRKSYEAGVRTTLDVLNAQQQKTLALRDLAQARYQYVQARIQLQALAGRDRWSSIQQVNTWLEH